MKEHKFSKEPVLPASAPRVLPKGSCDCHAHIFPSAEQYPTVNETMPLAPIDLYWQVHRHLGFERGVLVQGGAYRHDNRAMADALVLHPKTLRGVALLNAEASEATMLDLREKGVRALRFTRGGASRLRDLEILAPRMKALGFHVELYIGLEEFALRQHELLALGLPVVLDHLAGPFDAGIGVDHPSFQAVIESLKDGKLWVKLCPQRNSGRFPSYGDVRPYYDALVSARPDRLVWGSDWPYPNMSDKTPGTDDLLDIFLSWVGDETLQRRILVDNPSALYGF